MSKKAMDLLDSLKECPPESKRLQKKIENFIWEEIENKNYPHIENASYGVDSDGYVVLIGTKNVK
nr:hypothetical protein [uncultured Prevotella sp.]